MSARGNKDPTKTREGLVLLARLALEGKRYEHMLSYMRTLIEMLEPIYELTKYERDLFASACALFIKGHRESWHHVASKLRAAPADIPVTHRAATEEYLELIGSEIHKSCTTIFNMIDVIILPPRGRSAAAAARAESRVFYNKMKGDYLRYAAEVRQGQQRANDAAASFKAYTAAMEDAHELPATSPTRLELGLSLAFFHAEIEGSIAKAFNVACEVVDMAMQAIKTSKTKASPETEEVLERLQNNIDIWRPTLQNLRQK